MVIKNVTKRASKAMYSLSELSEILNQLNSVIYDKCNDDDLELISEAHDRLDEAQRELVKILAQDNKVILKDES